jgi:hypothetical protein
MSSRSSSKKTVDTDTLIVRNIQAFTSTDSLIPALTTLTSDGRGGTFWAIPSSLGVSPAINTITVDGKVIAADEPLNTFTMNTQQGMGSFTDPLTKTTTLFSKCFQTFSVVGGNTITSYSNSIVSPTMNLVGRNGIHLAADPLTQTLYFQGSLNSISTGIYGYSQVNVISNASTVTVSSIANTNRTSLEASSASTLINMVGIGDIILKANPTQNSIYMTISSFTSKGYHDLSGVAFGTLSSSLSTVSSLFCGIPQLTSTTKYLVNEISTLSTTVGKRISQNETNVMRNYTNKDVFTVFSNATVNNYAITTGNFTAVNRGILSTVSYSSTITSSAPFIQTYTGSAGPNNTFTVNTIQFRLDSLSTILDINRQVTVSYSPSLLFNNLTTSPGAVLAMSTFIISCNTPLPDSFYTRAWSPNNSPLYNDTINMVLPMYFNMASLTSSYTICHSISPISGSYSVGNTSVDILGGPTNTLSVLLTGTNYNSIE